jgi:excisionase family DNA binding protein
VDNFLTAKELQTLLKIDRTTLYRMLKDGRLTGLKIGGQWRFSRAEVNDLIAGTPPAKPAETAPGPVTPMILPRHCVQHIQNLFAEVAGIGSVTVAPTGEPLTEMSNCGRFCRLMLASESGRRACLASWRKIADQAEHQACFATCHAGLQYAQARIQIGGQPEAIFVAGQFYTAPPCTDEEMARIQQLAEQHSLDPAALAEAAQDIGVLDEFKKARLSAWLQSVAHTFEEIGHERAELMGRLRRISEMSTLEPA